MRKNTILIVLLFLLAAACKQSPVLKDTVLSLKDIKAIGELVTAEYYGEVISGHSLLLVREGKDSVFYQSLQNVRNEIEANRLEIATQFDKKITQDSLKLEELEQKRFVLFKKRKKNQLKKRQQKLEVKKTDKQQRVATKIKTPKYEASLKILSDATGERKKDLLKLIENEPNDTTLYNNFKQNIKDYLVEDKKELVYIGRGSVKVGYNLKEIDSTNIFFSPKHDTIYLLDFDPYITDLDINPYFYYPADSTIENADTTYFGFQIIYHKNQKKFSLNEVNNIKSDCKIKLRQDALKRDIYSNAHKNAEEALSTFFGLMAGKNQKVKKAIISHSKYFYYKTDYLYDLRIDENEYNELSELIEHDLDTLDDVSFKYQSLKYQQMHLDKLINDLYRTTQFSTNYSKWDSLYTAYQTKR